MKIAVGELKGITDALLSSLKDQGIEDSEALLEAARTPAGRKQMATAASVEVALILELANRADLVRLKGVGRVYSDLLEEAGVDTVKELARRSPENLHARLIEIAEAKSLTHRPPTLEQVRDFVDQASKMPVGLEY